MRPAFVLAALLISSSAFGAGSEDKNNAWYWQQAGTKIAQGKEREAAEYLRRCALEADARCRTLLGMWKIRGEFVEQDVELGVRWVKSAAKHGLPAAQAYLGLLYARGEGVSKNQEKALSWFKKGARMGHPMAQAALGSAHYLGDGLPQDRVTGYMWTTLAAEGGNEWAMEQLPSMEAELTPEQIAEARKRADKYAPLVEPEKFPSRTGAAISFH